MVYLLVSIENSILSICEVLCGDCVAHICFGIEVEKISHKAM